MFRVEPQLPEGAYTTYRINSPPSQRRAVPCSTGTCEAFRTGWRTEVDESSSLGVMQAEYIRKNSRRHFTELRDTRGITVFTFEPGQQCFRQHTAPIGEPLYLRYRGDHRTTRPNDVFRHQRAQDWVEDFSETQDKIAQRLRRA